MAIQKIDNSDLEIFVFQDFLTDQECQKTMTLIDHDAQPSTLYIGTEIDGFRTSSSCNLDPWDEFVNGIEERICTVLGIQNDYAETMQGQRYHVGEQFKHHHDFFHTNQEYWKTEATNGGQRSWTAMIYLNDVLEGGATEFPHAKIGVMPLAGSMIIWNNMLSDGTPNDKSLHAGTPVLQGSKYIVTKWFRQNKWGI